MGNTRRRLLLDTLRDSTHIIYTLCPCIVPYNPLTLLKRRRLYEQKNFKN